MARSGHIRIAGLGPLFLSSALAGELVGIREESDRSWLVSYARIDLVRFDQNASPIPLDAAS